MVFDDGTAFLRQIRLGQREIVRAIFAAVRDQDWNTVGGPINNLVIDRGNGSFEISFDVRATAGAVDFSWRGVIRGDHDGTVRYEFRGIAENTFFKNRIGLCVLHPIVECAGKPCRVLHTDGSVTQGRFPGTISPHQPFQDIRSLSHQVTNTLEAEVQFEGESFEMEDQRNWTDASFKTYSTPLALPFPVRLNRGERIDHQVTLRLRGDVSPPPPVEPPQTQAVITVDWSRPMALPTIGTGWGCGDSFASTDRADFLNALASLRLGHLRLDLHLSQQEWLPQLEEATHGSQRLGVPLHVAVFVTDQAAQELESLLMAMGRIKPMVSLWLIFHEQEKVTSASWVELARQKLVAWDRSIPLASGTNAYFAELNRDRPTVDSTTLPCYSINPQVHAFDDLSLVETLGAQRSTVEAAQTFSSREVVISPITLLPRFNPNATVVEPDRIDPSRYPELPSDPRQVTDFAAAWTIGSLASLATCDGVHALTYYEAVGPRGLMNGEGIAYPVYHVFRALADVASVYPSCSDRPHIATTLAWSDRRGRRHLLVAAFEGATSLKLLGISIDLDVTPLGPGGFERSAARSVTSSPDRSAIVTLSGLGVFLLALNETRANANSPGVTGA